MTRPETITDLLDRIAAIESSSPASDRAIHFPDPSCPIAFGALHEWFPAEHDEAPPLLILAHVARLALDATPGGSALVWIGRRVFPYIPGLASDAIFFDRSIFVDAPDAPSRLWAADVALRSPGVAAVIADGSSLDMPATRRLQLAARAGATLALLSRPARERALLSAASTRWVVAPVPSARPLATAGPAPAPGPSPRWVVDRVRSKGVLEARRRWTLESARATGLVLVPPGVGDGPGAASPAALEPARRTA